jgi:hypothetical protein
MASNRKQATSSLTDREKTLLKGKLPGQAAQKSGAAAPRRERASAGRAQGETSQADRARMYGDAGVKVEPAKTRRERSSPEPQDTAPTVGKTGGRGAKAERPSEGSDRRQGSAPPVEVTRTGKPPAETPNSRSTPHRSSKPNATARTER